jgi:hypothetical protein
MHPIEGRRLGRPDVGADVLHRVVTQREELSLVGESRLDRGASCSRAGAASEVLEAILDPPYGDAELARGEPDQDDIDVDGRLDPEAAARVGRGDQA